MLPDVNLPEWLARLETRHPKAIELGLERVGRVWRRLGRQPSFPVFSVAGTNGKGSVCAYLEAMLSEAGYRVGLYTSPHILRFNERIRVAGCAAGDADIVMALEAVEAARGDDSLTYFEHTTLAAMGLFQRQGIEVAVLEVGLGGRLDAVNLFDADCAVVTQVDLDHMDYLGPDRETIGYEKAGIFRPGRPAVCADTAPPASLLAHAAAIGAGLRCIGHDFAAERSDDGWLCRVGERVYPALPVPAMAGRHQIDNAAAAVAALDAMRAVLPVPMAAMRTGLARARMPGRFQVVGQAPLRILDVAHNPHAARALAASLADLPPVGRKLAVFAMLADKDAAGVIEPLAGIVDCWYLAGLGGPRGRGVEALAAEFAGRGLTCTAYPDVAAAWSAACQAAGPADT
ncbi:MAG: bifunctional tetrahydrofolate synthase/dihydrofolate synthase, partial [Thiobacillus sp.]|nr:bifunctional tetrahydrofolate synthase/dihydrofolate synthase [Thiobacillus sp.]